MKNSKNNILVNFHIGTGGRFNNSGHLTFVGVGNSAKHFVEEKNFPDYENRAMLIEKYGDEVIDLMTDLGYETEGDDFDAFEKKYGKLGCVTLFSCNGNEIGEVTEDECEYSYDEDGEYDTSYGILINDWDDLSEDQQYAVRKSNIAYELENEINIPEEIN